METHKKLFNYVKQRIEDLEYEKTQYEKQKMKAPTRIEERELQLVINDKSSRLNELYYLALEFDLPKPLPF